MAYKVTKILASEKTEKRQKYLTKTYGISVEDYRAMLEDQDKRCAICGEIYAEKLFVDHDHESGSVRGLLCYACNSAIGYLRDDPYIAQNAVRYLERHGKV